MPESTTKPVFEIINPSDPYTLRADLDIARAACLCLGRGAYGLSDEAGESALPVFLLGGFDEWAKEVGYDFGSIMGACRGEVADALDSVLIGGFGERRLVDAAATRMNPGDAREWMEERHDAMRSSANDIGARAKLLAEHLRKVVATAAAQQLEWDAAALEASS